MRVLLINPPQPIFNLSAENLAISWPMGILYVASATRQAGHEVRILDVYVGACVPFIQFNGTHNVGYLSQLVVDQRDGNDEAGLVGVGDEFFKFMIEFEKPDVIGVSLMFSSIHYFIPIILEIIKEAAPEATIVLGGAHATIAADVLSKYNYVDYVITGEGEVAFPRLLHAIENHEPTDKIPGVYPTPFEIIPKLDDVYPPMWSMAPIDQYFSVIGRREFVLITSRGCPFSCRFCSVPQSSRRRWRAHSVERVLAEIELAKALGATHIMFEDDNISLNKDRYCSILDEIIRRRLNLHLGARNILLTTLDREALLLMKLAGFTSVPVSAESGNDRVLAEEMGKKLTIADTERVVRESVRLGMRPFLNFVIGMPGETWNEIQQTGDFARKMVELGARGVWISMATPIYGTELFREVVEKKMLPEDPVIHFGYNRASFDGPDWTKEQLKEYRDALMKELNA